MLKRLILIAILLMAFSLVTTQLVAAQSEGGQFCVRAFEDRNSNGTRDPGEPLLTRGIVAELSNAQGVVIASQALEDSTNAAGGVICFPDLAAGTYMISIVSAEYRATTPNASVETITPGELPVVLDYGGVSMNAPVTTSTTSTDTLGLNTNDGRAMIQRLVASSLGSLAMVAIMVIIGVLAWLAVLRPRAMRRAAKRATSTGQYRAVTRDDMLSMYAPPTEDEFDAPR